MFIKCNHNKILVPLKKIEVGALYEIAPVNFGKVLKMKKRKGRDMDRHPV